MNKVWNKTTLIAVSAALALSLAACGNKNNQGEAVDPSQLAPSKAPAAAASAKKTQYPITIKDSSGMEITFEKAPERIVSVSPAETEKLFALGLGDKIVGVSDYDDYPAEAKTKSKMGGVSKPNLEAIIAANPDIVIAGISLKDDVLAKLRASNLKIFKVEPKKLDDVMNDILLFGQFTDRQDEAEKFVAKMKADRQKVVDAVKVVKPEQKKKVYLEFNPGWSVGHGEYLDELITLAGGINVAAESKGWHKISEEKIIQQNPQVILFAKGFVEEKSKLPLDEIIRGRSGWDKIEAIVNKQVIGIDQGLLSRPGPRLTNGLLEMAKAIYPELVK